jgi:hypothetical protein
VRRTAATTTAAVAAVAAVASGGGACASAHIAGPATLQASFPVYYAHYLPAAPDVAVAVGGVGGSSTSFVQEDLKALKELLFWAQDIVHARITIADNDDTALNKRFKALTNRYCSYVATLKHDGTLSGNREKNI